jgi:hypothetical protein
MLMSIAMPSVGVDRALDGIGLHDGAATLVGEQVHGVGGVVPQQVVGPAARLAQRIHVGAAEEVGLHIHLLDVELTRLDLLVHVLVAGVEAAGVAHHGHLAGLLLQRGHGLAVGIDIAQRDFHLHVLARFEAGNGLAGVHLRGRAQDHRVQLLDGQAVGQVGGDVRDAVFRGDFPGLVQLAADQRDHFHIGMFLMPSRCLMPKAPAPASATLMVMEVFLIRVSRIRWPTAVLDAGTW